MPRSPASAPLRKPAATRVGDAARTESPAPADLPRMVNGPALPHERDEAGGHVASTPDPVIVQAKKDIDAGLVDTDMRATPGLDAALRARLVPGTPEPQGKAPDADRKAPPVRRAGAHGSRGR